MPTSRKLKSANSRTAPEKNKNQENDRSGSSEDIFSVPEKRKRQTTYSCLNEDTLSIQYQSPESKNGQRKLPSRNCKRDSKIVKKNEDDKENLEKSVNTRPSKSIKNIDKDESCHFSDEEDSQDESSDESSESEYESESEDDLRLNRFPKSDKTKITAKTPSKTPSKSITKTPSKNITKTPSKTPLSKLMKTPSMHSRISSISKPSTPLQEARLSLHVSAVPKSLPCREEEFNNIFTFLKGRLSDNSGG